MRILFEKRKENQHLILKTWCSRYSGVGLKDLAAGLKRTGRPATSGIVHHSVVSQDQPLEFVVACAVRVAKALCGSGGACRVGKAESRTMQLRLET